MKNLVWIIVFCVAQIYAQEYIPWESYYFSDTTNSSDHLDYYTHSSIHPRINNRRTDYGSNKNKSYLPKRYAFIPVADFVGGLGAQNAGRFGLGFAADYIPIRGMHMKFAYVGGIATQQTQAYQGGVYSYSFLQGKLPNGSMHFHDIRTRLSYSPNKYFNFQIGLDHNKIGEGNRSLLLDEFGSPYPFAAMRLRVWRAEYLMMHTYFHSPIPGQNNFRPKHSAIHYLSMNLTKKLNISFFETVIYDGIIGGQRRGFEFEYMNPMIIYRPAEYGLGSSDKIQLGSNLSYRFSNKLMAYGQFVLDEFLLSAIRSRSRDWRNKFGFQVGIKGSANIHDGRFQYATEINLVRPFTYGHSNVYQAFTNMMLPLAHPYGANFIESSTRLLYSKAAWDFGLDVIYLMRGEDTDKSFGGDLNTSSIDRPRDANNQWIDEGYFIGSGQKYNLFKSQLTVGYKLLPKYRMRIFLTIDNTWLSRNGNTVNYNTVFFGFRSELWNDRRDY
jgi:hypothetical protein